MLAAIPESDPILRDSDPRLRLVSLDVDDFGPSLRDLVNRMVGAMRVRRGVGLAAIQIGVPSCVIVAETEGELRVMINPKITRKLNRETVAKEGCLSIEPRRWRDVSRPAKCEISWQDVDGAHCSGGFSGLTARVLQHEIDHFDGILITDKPAVFGSAA